MAISELDDAGAALGLAAKVDFSVLSGSAVEAAAEQVQRLKAQLAAVEAAAVAAYDASVQWGMDGHRSAAIALRHRCRLYGGEAASVVKLARMLRVMPETGAVLAAGSLSVAHARRLARAASRPEFAEAEQFLLSKAVSLSFKDFERAVAYWEQVVDEARLGGVERVDRLEQNRSVHASRTLDGATRLDGWLDATGGETFRNNLQRIEDEFFRADWQLAKQTLGHTVTVDKLWRSRPQRRADALVEMAIRAGTAPTDGKRPLPLLIVHADIDTFTTALANLLEITPPNPAGADRLCETDDGTVIAPTQMIKQAMVGHIRRLVYESPGVILDFGRKQRLFTGELRQAIQARDRECAHQGCQIPARDCDIDHTQDWNDNGHTNHQNGRPRCTYHHHNHKPRPG